MKKAPHDSTEQESFLSRWSRRKSGAGDSPVEPSEEVPDSAEDPAVVEPSEDSPVLTDEDMPPIESLDQDSDYSGFMSSGVSEKLRKMALRKLFQSAGFNIRDGLDDYDDDFTGFPALGNLITSDMKHQMEMAEKRKAEEAQDEAVSGTEEATGPGEGTEDSQTSADIEEVAGAPGIDTPVNESGLSDETDVAQSPKPA